MHRFYKSAPKLDTAQLHEIKSGWPLPGLTCRWCCTALRDFERRHTRCIVRGICKVNFATELREAYTAGVRLTLTDPAVYDPKNFGRAGMEKLKEAVMARIFICGCAGRAEI